MNIYLLCIHSITGQGLELADDPEGEVGRRQVHRAAGRVQDNQRHRVVGARIAAQ